MKTMMINQQRQSLLDQIQKQFSLNKLQKQKPQDANIRANNMQSVERSDRRRDLALYIVTGGGMAMTVYSVAVLYLVRDVPGLAFWMGVLAMINIMLVFTGILGLLVKRSLSVSRNELKISDHPQDPAEAEEALLEANELNGSKNQPS